MPTTGWLAVSSLALILAGIGWETVLKRHWQNRRDGKRLCALGKHHWTATRYGSAVCSRCAAVKGTP